ncbi:MAG TPA: cupin domain-containing protein [Nitrospiraceae bacterium]|nr:cupin domain-containing protein [Nitrospiraceae bacterium]
MLKRTLAECQEFVAGDHTVLRELLHPAKQAVRLGYSLAHGKLASGRRSKWHVLTSSEVYYFIAGQGRFTIDGETWPVEAGSTIYVPPGGKQSLENTGTTDVEFLCLVDPAWKIEDEAVLE